MTVDSMERAVRQLVDKDAATGLLRLRLLPGHESHRRACRVVHRRLFHRLWTRFRCRRHRGVPKTLEGVGTFFTATSDDAKRSNVKVEFTDDDTAEVRSAVYAWHRYQRERPDGHVMGQYHDVLVRTAAGWRFKRRELKHAGTTDFHTKPENQTMIGRRES